MSFLAPAYLAAAAGIAVLVVALHFISTREPATVALPTARFAPNRPVRARSRTFKPSDLLLLLCRTGVILCAGAALAQPVPAPSRRPLARIVLLDRSRAVASAPEAADSARAVLQDGDALVLFDSAARVAPQDSLASLRRVEVRGSVSAAMIAGLRAAVLLRDRADSLELVLVSPVLEEEVDQATDSIRSLWPGAIRQVRVAGATDSSIPASVFFLGPGDDPLRAALPASSGTGPTRVRIVRSQASPADSAWASGEAGTLVVWPTAHAGAVVDTTGAVIAGEVVVVAPFERHGAVPQPEGSRIVARWMDGVPAATEIVHGTGCIRTVWVPVPAVGDLVLDLRFRRLAARLTGLCGPAQMSSLRGGVTVDWNAGTGPLVAGIALPRPQASRSPLVPWLLGAALGLGLLELGLRRRRRSIES
jgi:hypothetical protein